MTERFKLDCFSCKHTVEIPTKEPCNCPLCGAELQISWGIEREKR